MDKEEVKDVKFKNIDVKALIALCHVLDDYSALIKDFKDLVSLNEYELYKISDILNKVSKGKKYDARAKRRLISQVKEFYLTHKDVIDTINKYSYIYNFTFLNNDLRNKREVGYSDFNYFYEYLLNHRNELEQVLSVLEKIKELGFKKLEFNKDADFTQEEYSTNINYNTCLNCAVYLENMEALPNHEDDFVRYKSKGSNYRIFLENFIHCSTSHIQLNNLVFDAERLPDSIAIESIFDKVINLKEEVQKACDSFRKTVNLGISIEDFQRQFTSTEKVIEDIDNIESKRELLEPMKCIKQYIDSMQTISAKYVQSLNEEYSITQGQVEKAIQKELKRRNETDSC